jgi:hypothetical protein
MRELKLEEKTGFSSLLPFTIYELNGQVFYSSDFTDHISAGRRLDFNLPAGEYKYDGSFTKLSSPVPVVSVTLPMHERNIQKKRYEIRFGENPNKCTIFYDEGVILFDNSFRNKPLYIKYAIYFHELGHHWYKTEWKADLFSIKKMLDKGFNPSQIGLASLETLTSKPESYERKMRSVSTLTKNLG